MRVLQCDDVADFGDEIYCILAEEVVNNPTMDGLSVG
jgi:hypothetical protein